MSDAGSHFDLVVIGSGPGGQKAAIQAAKAGRKVLLVERDASIGGACVHHGTIPSKTLHEMARRIVAFKAVAPSLCRAEVRADLEMSTLMSELGTVTRSHVRFMGAQLERNGITTWHGRASFVDVRTIEVLGVDRSRRRVTAEYVVIATGSRPRTPEGYSVDHTHVLDSDSILSLTWLPSSLTVFGAGVIAAEYATIYALLGVKVTMIEKGPRALAFMDEECVRRLLDVFEAHGGRFLGSRATASVAWDGVSNVVTTLADGEVIRSEKALVALGRVANVDGLRIENAGLAADARGLIAVDANCRTAVPTIYAVGDVIGPPALASCSMEQGRRAARHALGLDNAATSGRIPVGIYTYPELASIGQSEVDARAAGGCIIGRAPYEELARGQISHLGSGLLKLVADAEGRKLLGVHIVGDNASELVHIGQMALIGGLDIDSFINNLFNFPTLAEAYRVAALDIVRQRTVHAAVPELAL